MNSIYKNIIRVLTTGERKQVKVFIVLNTFISLLDIFCIIYLLFVLKFYTESNASFLNDSRLFADKNSVMPAIWLLLIFSAKNIMGHWVYQSQVKFITRIAQRLSTENLANYLNGAYSNFANEDSAVFVRKIIHQPTEFAQYVLLNFQLIITECVMVILSVITLLVYNAQLFLIAAIALLPPIFLLVFLTKRRLKTIKKNIKTIVEQSLQYLREALSGFVESNIFDKNPFFINRHTTVQAELGKKISSMQITQDLPARFFEVFAILGLFILIVAIKFSGTMGSAYIVLLGTFMAAAYKIIPGISKIINLNNQLRAYQHTIAEKAVLPEPSVDTINDKITSITFQNVGFSYNGNKILHRLNTTIYTGSLTGISGDSGKGKTTMLNLTAGFLQPEQGEILFNSETRKYLPFWSQIAYAKQDPFILHASILDNIVLFDEQYDPVKLNEVLEVTGLLKNFPEGIGKIIMEGGKNISGGQRQRIALARALYKDATVLLLDEPFSELDEASEIAIMLYLRTLAESGKIILLISHNPKSLDFCHAVINFNAHYRTEKVS
ncbi:ABC-type multidrug transport system, ATPase and permease component [Chitinophaga sp. YR573]|uniref:ATP-binding cassette domain-containing protein n=1 Tax=Chitinophaga sp. YR573 TaxID=1881040 RepID=UPI0008C49A3C|nr:ABC transporter ATP-binding protein [Chitinophaga sp. YR573]SEW44828.1 ABC-type multidrug transport system, ATPase and permease component [Chitinophaga sp. YR573]